jgi:Calcium binding
MEPTTKIKIGDSVIVKPIIQDPDFGLEIGGWQGRVSAVVEDGEVILIEWDSLTLKDIPDSMIAKCEEDGLAWDEMYLPIIDVELTTARDTKEDVTQIMSQIQAHHTWDHLGEEGRGIQKILDHVDPEDERAILQAWEAHFRKVLHFPFEAEVAEPQDRGRFTTGDRVVVQEITALHELYGILVEIQYKREVLTFPLCDLEAKDKKSPNYENVNLYVVWFANR